ncbi:hypothetical protein LUZ61_007067 [Rhynchospora tenuis]|uniref:Reverse transcriptase domain-containing protein n=1 Tax=Rhynchospora tenuis TaxID=198213 RepID=A0AAD6EW32_9POAL|nr:hypothetical protein LUZ61_007067 [Rhynchospora tenuis]
MRRKKISELHTNQAIIREPAEVARAFREYFVALLGTSVLTDDFNLLNLYPSEAVQIPIDGPFNCLEIKQAVFSMADNKASGPDGLINEFAKLHWETVQHDLAAIFVKLHEGTLQLSLLNQAHIVLVPKKDSSCRVEDFRPISVINYVPKLISKVLANRLKTTLPDLISASQTGFLSGRFIAENFNCARKILHHVDSNKYPAFLLQIDFAKAFDTVSWDFLSNVMKARGISELFISWVKLLLSTATSSIILDGMPGTPFLHQRGLRQGDPLSPYLFILAADVLTRLITNIGGLAPQPLTPKLPQPYYLFQYADDTIIFSSATESAVRNLKQTLDLFSSISGLRINFAKSSLVPLNLDTHTLQQIEQVFNCYSSSLPLTYLGLPLTSRKPDRACFQPLFEKLQRRLASWKSKLLSRAGRLQLISSVLSSIPIYHMSCFILPRWLTDKIESLSRNFLWAHGFPLKNWKSICLPKRFGGLGIKNLPLQNRILLLRWWWRLYTAKGSLWSTIMLALYARRNTQMPPLAWLPSGSFFWRELFKLRVMFQISTSWAITDGNSPSFWFDSWGGQPLIFLTQLECNAPRHHLSLVKALPFLPQLLPQPNSLRVQGLLQQALHLPLSTGRDAISWKWSRDGNFFANRTYAQFILAGKVQSPSCFIWKLKIPPKVKLFGILLLQGKILTQEVLIKRNIMVQVGCACCPSQTVENDLYLFFRCVFAQAVWNNLNLLSDMPIPPDRDSVLDTLLSFYQGILSTQREKWSSLLLTGLWHIWTERNNRRFRGESKPALVLARNIKADGEMFFIHS